MKIEKVVWVWKLFSDFLKICKIFKIFHFSTKITKQSDFQKKSKNQIFRFFGKIKKSEKISIFFKILKILGNIFEELFLTFLIFKKYICSKKNIPLNLSQLAIPLVKISISNIFSGFPYILSPRGLNSDGFRLSLNILLTD